MIGNTKLIRIFKIISKIILILVLTTFIINILDRHIEFTSEILNRFWSYFICCLILIFYIIGLSILKSFKKLIKLVIIISSVPVIFFTVFYLIELYSKFNYEPHTDRCIVYKNINKSKQYIIIQDYVNWKHNLPSVDTSLINDYLILRRVEHIKIMTLKGTWIKFDEKGAIIDTITFK